MDKKSKLALGCALGAVAAAIILLALTGFAFRYLLQGPEEVTDGNQLAEGDYVTADAAFLMDICGVERTPSGEAEAYLAIVPIGDQFVLVRFPAEEYNWIAELEGETQAYLRGERKTLEYHLAVTGMAEPTSPDAAALLEQWFSENAEWMSRSGMIAAVEDYSVYLCPLTIDTGRVGRLTTTAMYATNILAGALVLYALAETVVLIVDLSRSRRERRGRDHG